LGFLGRCVFLAHYFENDERLTSKPRVLTFEIAGHAYTFHTDVGVFSSRYIDAGSQILLETLVSLPLGKRLLDLGCGYGPIGIVLATQNNQLQAILVDINERAVALAENNIKVAKLTSRVGARVSDGFASVTEKFDTIVTNPPIRTGKATIYRLFQEAKEHLNLGGRLYLVIRKAQGADSTASYLKTIYNHVTRIKRDHGYHVYEAYD